MTYCLIEKWWFSVIPLTILILFPLLCASGRGFQCRNGLHVSLGHVCDGVDSCGDASDENPYLCQHICIFMGRKRFECWETAHIQGCVFGLELFQWCDGVNQCLTTTDLSRIGEDEKFCDFKDPKFVNHSPIRNENGRSNNPSKVGEDDNEKQIATTDTIDLDNIKDSLALLGAILGAIFFTVVGITLIVCCLCLCCKCHRWKATNIQGGPTGKPTKSKKHQPHQPDFLQHSRYQQSSHPERNPNSLASIEQPQRSSLAGSHTALASSGIAHGVSTSNISSLPFQQGGSSRAQTPCFPTPASSHSGIMRPETPVRETNIEFSHQNRMAHRPLPAPPGQLNYSQYGPRTYPGSGPGETPPVFQTTIAGDENYYPPNYNDVVNPPFNPAYQQ